LDSFNRQVNRLFDEFLGGFGVAPVQEGASADFTPRVNVSETDKEVRVEAELPGLDEKDITVELDEDALVLRGEKKAEREEKEDEWSRVERTYGSFHRVIPLPAEVEGEKAKATFKNGVLSIVLPRRPEPESKRKTIEIKAG